MFVRQHIHTYTKISDRHNVNTRNKHRLEGPYHRLHKVHNSFAGLGVRFYNKIPMSIIDLPLHKFKCTVKNHLIKRGYYTTDDYMKDLGHNLQASILYYNLFLYFSVCLLLYYYNLQCYCNCYVNVL